MLALILPLNSNIFALLFGKVIRTVWAIYIDLINEFSYKILKIGSSLNIVNYYPKFIPITQKRKTSIFSYNTKTLIRSFKNINHIQKANLS